MNSGDLFNQADDSIEWLDLGASRLGIVKGFIDKHNQLYQLLCDEIDWQQPSVRLYGKSHPVSRLIAFYGDEGLEYRYSGLTHRASGWPATLQDMRERIDSLLQTGFNTVLLNRYRDGGDTMGFHADDETSLGVNPLIASVSVGAERRFVIKPRNNKTTVKRELFRRELLLQGGSLLIMAGKFQSEWLHGVPADKKQKEGRINLTFRKVIA